MSQSNNKSFIARLNQHPKLRERVESLLNVVENTTGDCIKADDAEQHVRGTSQSDIAKALGREQSNISRELRRNKGKAVTKSSSPFATAHTTSLHPQLCLSRSKNLHFAMLRFQDFQRQFMALAG